MANEKRTARFAGMWWFLFMLVGPVSYILIDGRLLIPGDAAATIINVKADTALYWLGVAAFLAGYACFALLTASLCKLFKPFGTGLVRWMTGFVITGSALVIAGKAAEAAGAFATGAENAAFLFVLRTNLEMVAEMFWGLWLIPLVILVLKSGFVPKAVGAALLAAASYHLLSFAAFLVNGSDLSVEPVFVALGLGELVMAFWLLIMGARKPKEPIED